MCTFLSSLSRPKVVPVGNWSPQTCSSLGNECSPGLPALARSSEAECPSAAESRCVGQTASRQFKPGRLEVPTGFGREAVGTGGRGRRGG